MVQGCIEIKYTEREYWGCLRLASTTRQLTVRLFARGVQLVIVSMTTCQVVVTCAVVSVPTGRVAWLLRLIA